MNRAWWAIALLVLTVSAGGQGHGHGHGQGKAGGQCMGAGGGCRWSATASADAASDVADPAAILAKREQLQLTDVQVAQLRAIQDDARQRAAAVLSEAQRQQIATPVGDVALPSDRPMRGRQGGGRRGRHAGRDDAFAADQDVIHQLIAAHGSVRRSVEHIPGGVRATTTSDDPAVAKLLQEHVQRMKQRLEAGEPIRMMDPLFRELFRHADVIEMQIESVDGGVRITETSEDPEVAKLIRQHAHRFVTELVEQGHARAPQPTPLPDGYRSAE